MQKDKINFRLSHPPLSKHTKKKIKYKSEMPETFQNNKIVSSSQYFFTGFKNYGFDSDENTETNCYEFTFYLSTRI